LKKHGAEYEFVGKSDGLFAGANAFHDVNKPSLDDVKKHPAILCREVSKSYGIHKALSSLSLEISSGKIVGLLGPNGSGKTTLIKLIAGLLTLDSGEILINGKRIGDETRGDVAYLPERNSLPLYFTVGEAIGFYEDFFSDFDTARAERIIGDFSISRNKKIKALSKGEKEKLGLALVMSRNARLYILDEPISGVDPAARDYIIDTVLKNVSENSSVIIATHFISDVERIMDEFVFMKYGEIYAHDTPRGIWEKYGKTVDGYFKEVFKC